MLQEDQSLSLLLYLKVTIDSRVLLLIEDIKLFSANENIDIQLYTVVNGTKYKHLSVAGVEGMKVGPNRGFVPIPSK